MDQGGVLGFKKPLRFEAFNVAVGLVGMSLEHPDDIRGMIDEHHRDPDMLEAFQQVLLFQEAVLLGDEAMEAYFESARSRGDAIASFSPTEIEMLRQVVIEDFKCYMARRKPDDLSASINAYRKVLGLSEESKGNGLNGQNN